MSKIGISPPPKGAVILVTDNKNPAETYIGTAWEPVINNVFFVTPEKLEIDTNGNPNINATRPMGWRRIR